MSIGKVKWFNPTKGFGFIQDEETKSDIFIDMASIMKSGLDDLTPGQTILFTKHHNQAKEKDTATQIQIIS